MAIRPFVDRSLTRKPLDVEGSLVGREVGVPAILPGESSLGDQVHVADAIARGTESQVHLVDPSGASQPRTIPADADPATLNEAVSEWGGDDGRKAVTARQAARATRDYVSSAGLDTVILPAGEDGRHTRIATQLECDVVTIKGEGLGDCASMLVPVAGGPHAGPTVDAAARLAGRCDAWIDLLHVLPADADENEIETTEARLDAIAEDIDATESVTPWVLTAEDAAATIVEQSGYYGLTVIGAPTSGRLRRFLYGSTSEAIREEARSPVIAVRSLDRDG